MRVVGYIRVSTDEQAQEGVSRDNQRKRIEAFCVAKDWELVDVYQDAGKSGKDLNRDGVQELIRDCGGGKFEAVVVYKVDRITRRQRDLWHLIDDVFEPNSVGFVSVNEPFDTTSAIGKACLGMIGVFAQLERDLIAERTRDALKYKKEKGDYLGTVPLGFDIVDGELREREDELAVVRYAKKLRREGYSLGRVAGMLNGEGIPTKRGGKWYKSTVKYLLNNELYGDIE
jgi:site-specific DNA recombinase